MKHLGSIVTALWLGVTPVALDAEESRIEVGIATVDITPETPIWLNGYAARTHASERVDHPLEVTAVSIQERGGEKVVLVAMDNCELSPSFSANLTRRIETELSLADGSVIVVASHTHSAPVLDDVLAAMFELDEVEERRIADYSEKLRKATLEAVRSSLDSPRPAKLEFGKGTAGFGMNRRVYREDGVAFGENRDGPVDHDVPVLRVVAEDGSVPLVLFGYACHGTSIAGDDFYVVSGDYMAYARRHIEEAFPGTKAAYLVGFGADINPSPRGTLQDAKRHGLELAGAVTGVLNRPMTPVRGSLRREFRRIDLPLAVPPSRETLEEDAQSDNRHVRARAKEWLARLDAGEALPTTVSCPLEVIRFGGDLTLFFLAGEVVVDYAVRMKREFAEDNPWLVGYAFEVPCYIPSMRILKEGGYEADSSLIYYGIYGPLLGRTEDRILAEFRDVVGKLRP